MHCQAQASHHVVTRFNIILSTTTITTAIWITTANTNPSIQSVSGIAYNFNFQANITITKTQCIVYLETKAKASIHRENSIQNHLWNGFRKRISFQMQWRIYFYLKRLWPSDHFVDQSIITIKDKQPLKMKRASHLIEHVCFQSRILTPFSRANSQRQQKYKWMGNVSSNREIGDDSKRPPKTKNLFQIEKASLQKKIPLKTKNHKWQKAIKFKIIKVLVSWRLWETLPLKRKVLFDIKTPFRKREIPKKANDG